MGRISGLFLSPVKVSLPAGSLLTQELGLSVSILSLPVAQNRSKGIAIHGSKGDKHSLRSYVVPKEISHSINFFLQNEGEFRYSLSN